MLQLLRPIDVREHHASINFLRNSLLPLKNLTSPDLLEDQSTKVTAAYWSFLNCIEEEVQEIRDPDSS